MFSKNANNRKTTLRRDRKALRRTLTGETIFPVENKMSFYIQLIIHHYLNQFRLNISRIGEKLPVGKFGEPPNR